MVRDSEAAFQQEDSTAGFSTCQRGDTYPAAAHHKAEETVSERVGPALTGTSDRITHFTTLFAFRYNPVLAGPRSVNKAGIRKSHASNCRRVRLPVDFQTRGVDLYEGSIDSDPQFLPAQSAVGGLLSFIIHLFGERPLNNRKSRFYAVSGCETCRSTVAGWRRYVCIGNHHRTRFIAFHRRSISCRSRQ